MRQPGLRCHEAQDGRPWSKGTVYLAPGDQHMELEERGRPWWSPVGQEPPENFCRPAVDPMLRSIAGSTAPGLLVVILTGMGADGREGAKMVVEAGGSVVAQDEETSVVWGMPGAVTAAGLCAAVLPLSEIAPTSASSPEGVPHEHRRL